MVYRNNTGRLGCWLHQCVLRNTLAGSRTVVSISRNHPVLLWLRTTLYCYGCANKWTRVKVTYRLSNMLIRCPTTNRYVRWAVTLLCCCSVIWVLEFWVSWIGSKACHSPESLQHWEVAKTTKCEHSVFATRNPARALAACLQCPNHVEITTDKWFVSTKTNSMKRLKNWIHWESAFVREIPKPI